MSSLINHDDLAAFADRVVNLPRDRAIAKRKQVNTVRDRLKQHIASNPGFSLVKTLHAGSVAKGTALLTVNDFDLAVYVQRDTAPEEDGALVDWVADCLRAAYKGIIDPSQIEPGTHCVNITFKDSGTDIDVVPVLYDGLPDDRGDLVAKDTGKKLLTSVRLHLDFVQARKNAHPFDWAQVVRFVKWWVREQRLATSGEAFRRLKSFLVELICAHLSDTGATAFDDYPAALESVFDYIVRTELKERIAFDDYYPLADLPADRVGEIEVFDPVNPENNVARRCEISDRKQIVEAAAEALDAITEAGFATTRAQAIECWQVVLGPKFRGQ